MLGLRLVKKTVNFDDPGTYHLYYGDHAASPGTLLTFFLWDGSRRGRAGAGMTSAIAWSVPADALEFWRERLRAQGVAAGPPSPGSAKRSWRSPIPTGCRSNSWNGRARSAHARAPSGGTAGKGPPRFSQRDFGDRRGGPDRHVLTRDMGYRLAAREGPRTRYTVGDGGPGTYVDLLDRSGAAAGTQRPGHGASCGVPHAR